MHKQLRRKYPHAIGKRLITGVVFAIIAVALMVDVLSVFSTLSINLTYDKNMIEGIIDFTERNIDSDDLYECIKTGKMSSKFRDSRAMLDEIVETHDIHYLYLILPVDDGKEGEMMEIMNGVTTERLRRDPNARATLGKLNGAGFSPTIIRTVLNFIGKNDEILYFTNRSSYGIDYTGLKTIYSSKGEPVCVIGVDISIESMIEKLLRFQIWMFSSLALLLIVAQRIIYMWLRKSVIVPMERIERSAVDIAEKFHTSTVPEEIIFKNPNIHTGDELESLSTAIMTMSDEMKTYMTKLLFETAERERITYELNIAATIQNDLLPKIFPHLNNCSEVEFFASMHPAKEVGGDFYDYFMIDPDHMGLVIADVSGKGISAALYMVISKTLLKSEAQSGKSPEEVLRNVNNRLCENSTSEMFVTVWLGILDIRTGVLTASNAGHEFPIICHKGGKFELYRDKHWFVLGGMEGMEYKEYTIRLEPGCVMLFYTDGLPEANDANGELYGIDRVLELLNEKVETDPERIVNKTNEAVNKYVGDADQFDDITMLCIRLNELKK
ncbi:MAG: serine/threonine-protein phosphatase [Lachnospiraceae bacterium]|nr:serine/threonine-protein phosphatase [Lachnospiraceae bacterium]